MCRGSRAKKTSLRERKVRFASLGERPNRGHPPDGTSMAAPATASGGLRNEGRLGGMILAAVAGRQGETMLGILNGKRVLVVDDEPDVCRFVGFELAECEVESATTADQARERFAQGGIDICVLDIMGVNGFDL